MRRSAVAPAAAHGDSRLKGGVIGPWGLAALAIGITSPAMGLYALWGPMQAAAGPIAPLVFLGALAITLPTAFSYAGLNRHAPSTGAAAAWLWRGAGPLWGCLAGFVMMSYFVMTAIAQPLLFALFFRDFAAWTRLPISGSAAIVFGVLIQIGLSAWVCLRGAEASVKTTVRLMLAESAVVLALSATILISRASVPGGLNLGPFDPSHANGLGGFWAAMILGVLAFCGFDVVSTAAEEAQAPREHVPRAILLTVVGIALFWAINAWALTLSTPPAKVAAYNASGLTAITPVAEAYWGWGGILVIATAFTGVTAVSISCVQGASRIVFALARHGLLPEPLATLRGERRIPIGAVATVIAICVVLDLVSLPVFHGALQGFVWWSNAVVFFATLTFAGVNVANFLFFRRILPGKFGVLANVIVPIAGVAANLYLVYAAFFQALWSGPWMSGKSVVVACLALLALQIAAVLGLRILRPTLLVGSAPLGATTD